MCIIPFRLQRIPNCAAAIFDLTWHSPTANTRMPQSSMKICARTAIIMAEKDGKIHLLCYAMHYPTQRRRLVDDQTIEPGMTGVVKLYQGQVELADGEVTFSYARSVSFQKISYGISLMTAIAATFGIMLPLSLLAKFTRRKTQTQ